MLVLGRKSGQSILIDGNIRITVVSYGEHGVRVGIEAPRGKTIIREELAERGRELSVVGDAS